MTISFQNPGEIDITAMTTFGVNIKESANPIGFFGTGFKYAVAIILRNGGRITVYQGKRKLTFGTKTKDVRGTLVNIVTLSGKELGWATHVGTNWKAWQAFRELHSNVLDEKGFTSGEKLKPIEGFTTIQVDGWAEFEEAFRNMRTVFLQSKPDYVSDCVEVHPGPSKSVFYRGIRVADLEKPSQFTYNILAPMTLTEDRTVKHMWDVNYYVGKTVVQCLKADVVEAVVTAPEQTFEHGLNLDSTEPGETFLQTVGTLRKGAQAGMVTHAAKTVHDKHRSDENLDEYMPMTDDEKAMVEHAYRVLEGIGCHKVRAVPLVTVAFLGHGVFGKAHQGKMYLSKRAFTAGLNNVVGTIFEEYHHVEHGFKDCDRDFQNYLMDMIARLALKMNVEGIGL